MEKLSISDKVRGSMIAGAIGDALGYAVEFERFSQILSKYGPEGISRYSLVNGQAEISDDTQMSMYTACGLLNAEASEDPSLKPEHHIARAYVEWYITQCKGHGYLRTPYCWISKLPEMYSRRAPGSTCISSLSAIASGKEPRNNSKGCGGIMRVAPIGLRGAVKRWPLAKTIELACKAAECTHQHPMGFLSAGVMAGVVQLIALHEGVPTADDYKKMALDAIDVMTQESKCDGVHTYGEFFRDDIVELTKGTLAALNYAQDGLEPTKAILMLGEGWVGDEAWYISLYCAARFADDPIKAIIASVNHSGDSDSTGAITGNLAGCAHGFSAIPEEWITPLELHNTILQLADQLSDREGK